MSQWLTTTAMASGYRAGYRAISNARIELPTPVYLISENYNADGTLKSQAQKKEAARQAKTNLQQDRDLPIEEGDASDVNTHTLDL